MCPHTHRCVRIPRLCVSSYLYWVRIAAIWYYEAAATNTSCMCPHTAARLNTKLEAAPRALAVYVRSCLYICEHTSYLHICADTCRTAGAWLNNKLLLALSLYLCPYLHMCALTADTCGAAGARLNNKLLLAVEALKKPRCRPAAEQL